MPLIVDPQVLRHASTEARILRVEVLRGRVDVNAGGH